MGNKIIISLSILLIWSICFSVFAKTLSIKELKEYNREKWLKKKRPFAKKERKYFCGYSSNKKKIWIIVKTEIFAKEKFKITPCDPKYGNPDFCLINDKTIFGSAHSMPTTYLAHLQIQIGSKAYSLDSSDMYNSMDYVRDKNSVCNQNKSRFETGEYRNFTLSCGDEDNCIIRGRFGSAAGSYVAEWNIDYGVSRRNIITNDYDILDLFSKEELPLYVDD